MNLFISRMFPLLSFLFCPLMLRLDAGDGGGGGAGGGEGGGSGGEGAGGGNTPPAFDIRQHVDDAGNFKPGWAKAAGLPEPFEKKFTRPEAAFRSHVTLETQIGKKGVIIPGPTATKEEHDAFATALGRPAKPEEYGFTKPDKIKVGDAEHAVPDIAWDAKRAESWAKKLHEWGVPKDQAQKIMSAAVEESVTGLANIDALQKQNLATAKATLKTEWGADFDKNMGAAMRAADQFGGDEIKNHPAFGNDPVLIKLLAKVGAATAERPPANGRQQATNDSLTPAEAKIKGDQLTRDIQTRTKADRSWATTPEAQAMKAEKSRMYQLAHPE